MTDCSHGLTHGCEAMSCPCGWSSPAHGQHPSSTPKLCASTAVPCASPPSASILAGPGPSATKYHWPSATTPSGEHGRSEWNSSGSSSSGGKSVLHVELLPRPCCPGLPTSVMASQGFKCNSGIDTTGSWAGLNCGLGGGSKGDEGSACTTGGEQSHAIA
eukprot:CAMPEP_0175646062 /NCGR_PEP_ID=MMETSP0097-20121207/7132_1 /TAXON_ID=311494 /ORGANISM="Alexandrium monilatum, Strain CCMP3105" /LENGTH=159 /DNA_ID=CAMNT_0016951957 /DNA_START=254 /DNA_END=730 /DNA_ORIENTATION=+